MISFFHKVIDVLNDTKIPYMLSGSVAMGVHIIPRATRDFDFVVYMQQGMIYKFVENFKEGYYCNEESIRHAIKTNGIFNIIDNKSQYKADFILMKESDYGIEAFNRRIEIEYFEKKLFVITVEDLLIAKTIWIQELESSIQKEDIRKLCELESLDWIYINKWTKKLRLKTYNLF